jgi:hypothetical protein
MPTLSHIALDIRQTLRLQSTVERIASLPPELVEEILIKLPLSAILDLYSRRNQSINDCILNSPAWKPCWGDGLETLLELFDICCGFWALWTVEPFRLFDRSPLAIRALGDKLVRLLNAYADMRGCGDLGAPENLLRFFNNAVLERKIYLDREKNAGIYVASWKAHDSDSTIEHQRPLEFVKAGMRVLLDDQQSRNATMSRQLKELAELYARHPDRLRVKFDTSCIPRPNPHHIYHGLMHRAAEVMNNTLLGPAYGTLHFYSSYAAVAPHDRCLKLFVECLLMHPPKPPNGALKNPLAILLDKQSVEDLRGVRELSGRGYAWNDVERWSEKQRSAALEEAKKDLRNGSTVCHCSCHSMDIQQASTEPQPHEYPQAILVDIDRARQGMHQIYRAASRRRPRPRASLSCCAAGALALTPPTACDSDRAWAFSRQGAGDEPRRRARPLDDGELAWLGAFLRCVEHMERAFPDVAARVAGARARGGRPSCAGARRATASTRAGGR